MKEAFRGEVRVRGERSRLGRWAGTPREKWAELLLGVVTVGSVLAIGAVHTKVFLLVATGACVAAALTLYGGDRRVSIPFYVLLFLAAYSMLQALPLPLAWVRALSPAAADVWERSLLPFGEKQSWASLSLDPGASLREAAKWLCYGGMFITAAGVGQLRGASRIAALLFFSALAAAAVTLLHGVFGATRVYGVYEPRYGRLAWHMGPLLNPNNLASYLNLGLLCGLGLLLDRRRLLPVPLVLVGCVLIVAVEVVTGSRGGQLALACGVGAMLVFIGRNRSAWRNVRIRAGGHVDFTITNRGVVALLSVGIVALVGAGALLAWIAEGQALMAQFEQGGLEKLRLVAGVKPVIAEYPVFGIGRGAFESVFAAFYDGAPNIVYTHPENFVAQWIVEWGVPVGVGALGAFAWAMRPAHLKLSRGTVGIALYAGIGVVMLQNLLDVGTEVPGVAIGVVVALGGLLGARSRTQPAPVRHPRGWALALGMAGAASVLLVAVFARETVANARDRLRDLYRGTQTANLAARRNLRAELHSAMRQHPAEPFFPRLGAALALRARDDNPFPWIQRALERSLSDGRSHYLLANILADRGRRQQALMELKFAATFDPSLATPVAQRAAAWASSYADLTRAVPEGEAGVPVLAALGRAAKDPETQERCLEEALLREPSNTGIRLILANASLEALRASASDGRCGGPRRTACVERARQHARRIAHERPESSIGTQLLARVLETEGRTAEAEALLGRECARFSDLASCLYTRLGFALRLRDAENADAVARQLVLIDCAGGAAKCASAAESIADQASRHGMTWLAMNYYSRATREEPSAGRWRKVASTATRAGLHSQALHALEELRRAGGAAADTERLMLEQRRAAEGVRTSTSRVD